MHPICPFPLRRLVNVDLANDYTFDVSQGTILLYSPFHTWVGNEQGYMSELYNFYSFIP